MNHILPIPSRQAIRIAAEGCISRWAETRGLDSGAVHRTIHRYGGRTVDLSAMWGLQTRGILLALVALVEAADPLTFPGPAPTPAGDSEPPAGGAGSSSPVVPPALAMDAGVPARGSLSTASTGPDGAGTA